MNKYGKGGRDEGGRVRVRKVLARANKRGGVEFMESERWGGYFN